MIFFVAKSSTLNKNFVTFVLLKTKKYTLYKIFISKNEIYSGPIKSIFKIISKCFELNFNYVNNIGDADFIFDHKSNFSCPINFSFFTSIMVAQRYSYDNYFKEKPIIYFENGQPDWLSSSFYMLNCFQEYGFENNDAYNRFQYRNSYQFKYNCVTENLVFNYLKQFCLDVLKLNSKILKSTLSKVFLSHDIDSVNGSFLQDGLWAFKQGRIDIILKLIFNEVIGNPDWQNIDKINSIHTLHGMKSAFFWLVSNKIGEKKIKNGDYSSKQLKDLSNKSEDNGLHKSTLNFTINEELNMLPFETKINRHHFLKFQIPNLWFNIGDSNVKLDSSLGFADHYGFRNSFGLPFKPFNLEKNVEFDFIEVPLNVMDGTFYKYLNVPVKNTSKLIVEFFEKNKYDCLISVLWHNTFFTNFKYKGYAEEYRKLLQYLVESRVKSVSSSEIIKEYC